MALTSAPVALIGFDLDGTLIDDTVYIWNTLHEHFGCDPEKRKQAASDFRQGRISYAQWFENDLEMLKARKASRKAIERLFDRLQVMQGAHETLGALKERGYLLAVISGSLDILVEHFFPGFSFDALLINRIQFNAAGEIVGGIPTPYDFEGKASGLELLAKRFQLPSEQIAFVGDNVNDLSALRFAGFSIGFNIKSPEVALAANVVVGPKDLKEILPYFPDRLEKAGE